MLSTQDYPKHRHPGWNKGSIAYHADDGKIFIGSGVGDPFGPKCCQGEQETESFTGFAVMFQIQ